VLCAARDLECRIFSARSLKAPHSPAFPIGESIPNADAQATLLLSLPHALSLEFAIKSADPALYLRIAGTQSTS
jgi:hypothetical protein